MRFLCVFCGANVGDNPAYARAAVHLVEHLHARNIGLIYGGGRSGIMGALADAMLSRGGRVIGIVPSGLFKPEVVHDGLSELRVVDSMLARKELMFELADAFLVLPGGFGTLDELFEVLTGAQLGLHAKPCGLLNVANYYDELVSFLNHAQQDGFLTQQNLSLLQVGDDPAPLLDRLQLVSRASH